MTYWQAWMACGLLMSLPTAAQADIFRWDNGQLIPGTEGITPGPGIDLSSRSGEWSSLERNLGFADFSGGLDLTEARFEYSWFDDSRFNGANLTGANLLYASLTNADLSGTNLTNASLGTAGCPFACAGVAILTNANLSGAVVTGARFNGNTSFGFIKEQLYSTASYQQRNLGAIGLSYNDLTGWDFSGQDLTGAYFSYSTLTNADLSGTNLTDAYLGDDATSRGFTKEQLYSTANYQQRNLRGIGLRFNDLTSWDFSGQDLTGAYFTGSMLTSANFAGAVVAGADFERISDNFLAGSGITPPQLYSTASYQQRNLRGTGLVGSDLTSGDFSGQDLTGADLRHSTLTNGNLAGANLTSANFVVSALTNANLAGANLTSADLGNSTLTNANFAGAIVTGASFFGSRDFTKEQLYSTANYQQRDLRGIRLGVNNNLTGWDFSGQDLSGAYLGGSTLTNANLAGAMVTRANIGHATGFTKEQLYSTASYQQKDLRGIGLNDNDLTGWDFSGQDLTGADFGESTLTNANLAAAMVTGAWFGTTTRGFTKEQLYSTASYQQRNLRGIGLAFNNLTSWDFSGQDLAGANFSFSRLTNTNFEGAVVAGANFHATTSIGLTKDQLYSTASYQQRDLRGIQLSGKDLTGWDFSGQDLTGAFLHSPTFRNVNFSFADLRGAQLNPSDPIQLARNTIREFGAINGLDLAAGETLVVRDSDIGITVNGSMNALSGGTLELVLGDTDWGSTMAVAVGVTPDLGGTLRVRFADQANLASMLGTTFDFFNWPGVLETNNRFDAIELPPGTQWDLNQLYVTGTAKLTAIPEPSAVLLFACGTAACALARRRILANRRRLWLAAYPVYLADPKRRPELNGKHGGTATPVPRGCHGKSCPRLNRNAGSQSISTCSVRPMTKG